MISDVCNLIGFIPYDLEKVVTYEENQRIYKKEINKGPVTCQNVFGLI